MGCNIHGCVEAKVYGKEWNWLGEIPNYRDYSFYAKIAGVRNREDNPIVPIVLPRGLPSDVTNITKVTHDIFMEETGGHDASFLDGVELHCVHGKYYPFWGAYLQFLYALGDVYGNEAVRMVFWFDN